jgi:hypothetical protein
MKRNPIDWGQEVRGFLEHRVKQVELIKVLKEVEPRAKKRKAKGDSTLLIREDRPLSLMMIRRYQRDHTKKKYSH